MAFRGDDAPALLGTGVAFVLRLCDSDSKTANAAHMMRDCGDDFGPIPNRTTNLVILLCGDDGGFLTQLGSAPTDYKKTLKANRVDTKPNEGSSLLSVSPQLGENWFTIVV